MLPAQFKRGRGRASAAVGKGADEVRQRERRAVDVTVVELEVAKATLRDAARLMMTSAVGALVVGSAHDAQGVVSERDLARAVAEDLDPDLTPVGDLASRELVWCDVESTVEEVAAEMLSRYIRHVLVEEDGELVGIVSARDLLGAYSTEATDLSIS